MRQMLDDPAEMTPFERRRRVAALLARGVLRLRQSGGGGTATDDARAGEKDSKSRPTRLDESAASSPDVPTPGAVNETENGKELDK